MKFQNLLELSRESISILFTIDQQFHRIWSNLDKISFALLISPGLAPLERQHLAHKQLIH